MQTFKITIADELFGQLAGEFVAPTEEQAIREAKEFYAHENDTTEEHVEIVSVENVTDAN